MSAFAQRPPGTQVLYPEVNGQRGNPVLFSGELVAAMLAPGIRLALRKYIDEHPDKVHIYPSSNERFTLDLDTREDLAAFERRTGLALALPEVR
jgi:CTP:molybdopterin cytidylyltransferase MocA